MADFSLTIQPFGYTPTTIRPMMEKLREVHESPGGDHVYNILIEHVATRWNDPPDWPVIDVIMEYAPGGSKATFDNLFVGSANLHYTGTGHEYREGVKDPAFRAAALARAQTYARQFYDRYPNRWYNFYVDFEAVANWWVEADTREGYAQLLAGWQDMYEGIAANRQMLYAPATWSLSPPRGMKTAVVALFNRIRQLSDATHGINWITFQDMYGRQNTWLDPTPADTQVWYDLYTSTGLFDSVGVTAEMFEITPTWYGVGDPTEIRSRLDSYVERGIKLGFLFELRYWYQCMAAWGGEPGLDVVPPLGDTPAYMSIRKFGKADAEFASVEALLGDPDNLVEATIIGLHD